ncbi:MAG: autotransporter-associated beta strand repeat-containing protein [Pirellulales bacterium]|nr:autotransporter-associated beta strand repeat-containing protein [Pirellulales bacterium]
MATRWLRALAMIVGWSLAAGGALAQSTEWTNPTLGNWFFESNWDNGVPDSNDKAVFDNGGTALITSPGAVAGFLMLGEGYGYGGHILITNGGTLIQQESAEIGGPSAQFGASATISGNGSRWRIVGNLITGPLAVEPNDRFGTHGTLRIESGGDVLSVGGIIGNHPESRGVAVITGAGSTWMMSGNLWVQYQGTLTISNGGTVGSGGTVSTQPTFVSDATATVTGTGSLWSDGGNLEVRAGGVLRISDRGLVQAASLRVFDTGSVEVNNAESTIAGLIVTGGALPLATEGSLGSLIVANSTSGRMVVQGGGTVSNSLGIVAATSGMFGSVLVQGAGSTWTNTDNVFVGLGGNGTLEVRNGGTLNSVRGFAGANAFSSGIITVTDPGSTWNASGSFFLGNAGSALLSVLNGGVASTTGNSHLGFTAGATGDVNVSGAGSTLNIGVLLNIGGDSAGARGTGSVRIADGGIVNVGSATNLYSTGRLDLVNETTFTGDVNSFGGMIRTIGTTTLANAVHLNAGGVSVETNTLDGNAVFSGIIDGAGGLTKSTFVGITGKGTLALTAANTYTGATTVNAGTLLVDGSITSATTVNSGATLGGSGTIAADVTLNNGAIVAPGNSPGTLNIAGNYTQNSGGTLKIELASPTSFDRLAVTGNAALGGTLEVSLIDGFIPTADQTFDILSFGSVGGAFSSVILPSVEGLVWDASQLAVGVIGVDVINPPLAPADFDENGMVDGADLMRWQDNFGSGTTHTQGDADADGDADGADFLVWQRQLGNVPVVAATAAVPEPSNWLLCSLATAGATTTRRRREA